MALLYSKVGAATRATASWIQQRPAINAVAYNHYRSHQRDLHSKSWKLPVTPGGTLKARIPKTCLLTAYPLDPHQHDWSYALVDMHVIGRTADSRISAGSAAEAAEEFGARVISDSEPGRSFIQIEAPPESIAVTVGSGVHRLKSWLMSGLGDSSGGSDKVEQQDQRTATTANSEVVDNMHDCQVVLNIGVPGRFDLDLEVAHGSVKLTDTFEGDIKIHTVDADIHTNRLKSMYIDIESADDNTIRMDQVHGNLSLRATQGLVDIGKLQGPSIRLVSDDADIQIRALYGDYSMIRSTAGTVRVGGAKGYTKIRTGEGDVEVAGADGRLDIESDCGDIEANLTVPRTVTMRSRRGDIAVGLPDNMIGNVLFEAGEDTSIDPALNLVPDGREEEEEQHNRKYEGFESDDRPDPNNISKGQIGMQNTQHVDEQLLASVHARAPTGDVRVTKQSWGAMLYSSGKKKSFPRWVEAES